MTLEQFDTTKWGAEMYIISGGFVYPVISVDFEDKTICYEDEMGEVWVNHSDVELDK